MAAAGGDGLQHRWLGRAARAVVRLVRLPRAGADPRAAASTAPRGCGSTRRNAPRAELRIAAGERRGWPVGVMTDDGQRYRRSYTRLALARLLRVPGRRRRLQLPGRLPRGAGSRVGTVQVKSRNAGFALALVLLVFGAAGASASSSDLWQKLRRPLHLPEVAAGADCPVSAFDRRSTSAGTAWERDSVEGRRTPSTASATMTIEFPPTGPWSGSAWAARGPLVRLARVPWAGSDSRAPARRFRMGSLRRRKGAGERAAHLSRLERRREPGRQGRRPAVPAVVHPGAGARLLRVPDRRRDVLARRRLPGRARAGRPSPCPKTSGRSCAGRSTCRRSAPELLARSARSTKGSTSAGTAWRGASGRGPAWPIGLAQPGSVLRFTYPPPPGSLMYGSEWSGNKVLWFVSPAVVGPVLVRGRRIDGPGDVRFDLDLNPSTELRLPTTLGHPSTTRVRAAGCYAYQVDGPSFSYPIVFRAELGELTSVAGDLGDRADGLEHLEALLAHRRDRGCGVVDHPVLALQRQRRGLEVLDERCRRALKSGRAQQRASAAPSPPLPASRGRRRRGACSRGPRATRCATRQRPTWSR